MKFYPLLLSTLFLFSFSIQTKGQSISSTPDASNPLKIDYQVSQLDPFDLAKDPKAHYRIFFAYGDGNYYRGSGNMNSGSSMNVDYSHEYLPIPISPGSPNTYNPTALIYSRKSNDPPPFTNFPDPDDFSISSGTNPVDNIQYTDKTMIDYTGDGKFFRRVALDHSHFLTDSAWSSFIVGYRPTMSGALFFFFDSEAGNTMFDSTKTTGSRYGNFEMSGTTIRQPALNFRASGPQDPLQPTYDEVLRYTINSNEIGIDQPGDNIVDGVSIPEELRLFNYLQSLELTDQEEYNFMVVLARNTDIPPTEDISLATAANWHEDENFISNYLLGPSNDYELSGPGSGFAYVDAAQLKIKEGDPKDPNEVKITNICGCGNDKYKVTFELTYCNVNPVPTESATLYFKDVQNILSCYKMPHPSLDIGDAIPYTNNSCPENVGLCASKNFMQGMEKKYCVGTYSIAKMPYAQNKNEKCRVFQFTAQIDTSDIKKLEDIALEACVNFHETNCEFICSSNIPLKGDTSIYANTLKSLINDPQDCQMLPCENCNTGVIGIGFPWNWLIGVVVVGGIIFFFWEPIKSILGLSKTP